MNIFEKKCACGGIILGARLHGKARGEWLGYDECRKCRKRREKPVHPGDAK